MYSKGRKLIWKYSYTAMWSGVAKADTHDQSCFSVLIVSVPGYSVNVSCLFFTPQQPFSSGINKLIGKFVQS